MLKKVLFYFLIFSFVGSSSCVSVKKGTLKGERLEKGKWYSTVQLDRELTEQIIIKEAQLRKKN